MNKKIIPSIESKFADLASKLNKKKKIKYSFGLGEPFFNTPKEVILSAFKAMNQGLTRYGSPLGIESLREEILKGYRKKNLLNNNDGIIITPGSKMALSLIFFSSLKDSDEVINFTPCYSSYVPQILISGKKIKINQLSLSKHNFSIDFKKLSKLVNKKTKFILINSPHNPTGKLFDKNELIQLGKVLNKNPNCMVISDEIYDKYIFENKKMIYPRAIKSLKNKTIILNGFSKTLSMTGWRIGYCIAPKKMIKKMSLIQQHLNTNVPIFTQVGALNGLRMKKLMFKNYLRNINKNLKYLEKKINETNKVTLNKPEGGFFCFISIKKLKINSDKFCYQILKKQKIAITPGHYFGKEWNNFIRISMVIEHKKFKKATDLLIKFIDRNRGK